jgi:hypothetical protein
LYWNSWSPCYSEGIRLNGIEQDPDANTPCYDAYLHQEKLNDISSLKKGTNELKTLKTPLYDGQMVHGMDVQWPGVMLKIKRDGPSKKGIHIVEGTYENRPHYIINTKLTTYYFDKAGGGFSRIIDTNGNDWVSYKTEPWNEYPASAASGYRGLPNLVFKSDKDSGAGHPGHDKCISEISAENKIRTTTKSGLWEWEWTFFDDHAVLEVLKTEDGIPYWFLYEGTPGGSYKPSTTLYGTNVSGPNTSIPDFYQGNISFGNFDWAYFTNKRANSTFYIAQATKDQHIDMMSYLGNSKEGALSKDGMTVFGFGRGDNNEPLLKGKNTFIIGMIYQSVITEKEHLQVAKVISDSVKLQNQ